jgi:hypothetical protein
MRGSRSSGQETIVQRFRLGHHSIEPEVGFNSLAAGSAEASRQRGLFENLS